MLLALDRNKTHSTTNVLQAFLHRKQRLNAARAAVAALTFEERTQLIQELLEQLEGPDASSSEPLRELLETPPPGEAPVVLEVPSGAKAKLLRHGKITKSDAAAEFIRMHPEGVSLKIVAKKIQQKPITAKSTLRYVERTKGSICSRGGLWFPTAIEQVEAPPVAIPIATPPAAAPGAVPVASPEDKPAQRGTYREAILIVVQEKPLEAGEIFKAVAKRMPNANKRSVVGEVKRMGVKGQLVVEGHGPNGRKYTTPKKQGALFEKTGE